MHLERVVTFHQHIPAPITNADDERVDLEIGRRLPRAKNLENSLLRIFVLDGRALLTFIPGNHVLHRINLLFHPGPGSRPRGEKVYAWSRTRVERYYEKFRGILSLVSPSVASRTARDR